MRPKDFPCPVCKEPVPIDWFPKPVLMDMLDDGYVKQALGAYSCAICGRDGTITGKTKTMSNEQ